MGGSLVAGGDELCDHGGDFFGAAGDLGVSREAFFLSFFELVLDLFDDQLGAREEPDEVVVGDVFEIVASVLAEFESVHFRS